MDLQISSNTKEHPHSMTINPYSTFGVPSAATLPQQWTENQIVNEAILKNNKESATLSSRRTSWRKGPLSTEHWESLLLFHFSSFLHALKFQTADWLSLSHMSRAPMVVGRRRMNGKRESRICLESWFSVSITTLPHFTSTARVCDPLKKQSTGSWNEARATFAVSHLWQK